MPRAVKFTDASPGPPTLGFITFVIFICGTSMVKVGLVTRLDFTARIARAMVSARAHYPFTKSLYSERLSNNTGYRHDRDFAEACRV